MGLGPQGQLYAGRVLVTVAVNDAADDAAGIAVGSPAAAARGDDPADRWS